MMKTTIYIRTSTIEQNPQNQLADCLNINKWGEYIVLEDKQSAWKDHIERENFDKILYSIKQRRVDHLIVWDLDRIYRNRKRLVGFFKLCKVYKCHIHSYRQQWLEQLSDIPSPWNEIMMELMIQIMGWMAEDESTKKSERVKAAVRRDGNVTKSYKGNKWGRKGLSTQVVNKVLELRKQGMSIREIAGKITYWDKNKNECPLSKSVVHKILTQST